VPLYAFHAVMHVFFLLVTPQTMTGKKFVEVEKDMIITLQQGWDYMEDAQNFPLELFACPLHSSHCTLVLPSLTTNFPHIPFVYCTFTMHFNILPVNFCQTNILSVYKLYHRLYFTGSGIFSFQQLWRTGGGGGKMTPFI